jgi:hypothetical protein
MQGFPRYDETTPWTAARFALQLRFAGIRFEGSRLIGRLAGAGFLVGA